MPCLLFYIFLGTFITFLPNLPHIYAKPYLVTILAPDNPAEIFYIFP